MESDQDYYGLSQAEGSRERTREVKENAKKPFFAHDESVSVPDDMIVIGIAGSAGKSTTIRYIKKFLNDHLADLGQKGCVVFENGEARDGCGNIIADPEGMEPDAHRLLNEAYNEGIRYACVEVTESDLKNKTFSGVKFEVVALLNIFGDNPNREEHFSFIEYFNTLITVFEQGVTALVNCECVYREGIFEAAEMSCRVLTCGWSRPSDYYAYDMKTEENYGGALPFSLHAEYEDIDLVLPTNNPFDLQDVLIAIAAVRQCGVSFASIKKSLENLSGAEI